MQGVEISHCNAAIDAVLAAYYGLLEITVGDAQLSTASTFGKRDTLVIDGTPEIILSTALRQYDSQAIIITEEIGTDDLKKLQPDVEDPRRFRTIFLADPMDRSVFFARFLATFDSKDTIGAAMCRKGTVAKWEAMADGPAAITGAASAITCVRRGLPLFSIMVNYITRNLILCCGAGTYVMDLFPTLETVIDLDFIRKHGKRLGFRSLERDHHDSMRRFVTFTGKSGYRENLEESNLMKPEELASNLHYSEPGGPLRILYLSSFQPEATPMGFVLANGEKIGEWIHWLPFVRFVKDDGQIDEPAFRVYEVFQNVLHTKDGTLMATPPPYSIFQESSVAGGKIVLDVRRVSAFMNPSKIRSTILVVPRGNSLMTLLTRQYGHREILFPNEW